MCGIGVAPVGLPQGEASEISTQDSTRASFRVNTQGEGKEAGSGKSRGSGAVIRPHPAWRDLRSWGLESGQKGKIFIPSPPVIGCNSLRKVCELELFSPKENLGESWHMKGMSLKCPQQLGFIIIIQSVVPRCCSLWNHQGILRNVMPGLTGTE